MKLTCILEHVTTEFEDANAEEKLKTSDQLVDISLTTSKKRLQAAMDRISAKLDSKHPQFQEGIKFVSRYESMQNPQYMARLASAFHQFGLLYLYQWSNSRITFYRFDRIDACTCKEQKTNLVLKESSCRERDQRTKVLQELTCKDFVEDTCTENYSHLEEPSQSILQRRVILETQDNDTYE